MQRLNDKPIATHRLAAGAGIQRPGPRGPVRIDSPAIDVMTDFAQVFPVTVLPQARLAEANQLMISRGVRLLLVTATGGGLIGLITARDTMGERPMQLLHQRGGTFDDLSVADLMRKVDEIDVVDIEAVLHATVGDVVATLKALGRQHLLVGAISREDGRRNVRGIFSSTQIGRSLGIPIQTYEVARTFSEIEQALAA